MFGQVKDLAGIGEITCQIKEFVLELIRHRSAHDDRILQRESQKLRNDEQELKNQVNRLNYAIKILELARKYQRNPEEIQAWVTLLTTQVDLRTSRSGDEVSFPMLGRIRRPLREGRSVKDLMNTRLALSPNDSGTGKEKETKKLAV